MRVVYCLNSLASFGGVAIITIAKADALSRNSENKIFIISQCDDSGCTCVPVSSNVGLLGMRQDNLTWRHPWVLFQQAMKLPSIIKRFRGTLLEINPDIVISTGGFDRWLVPFAKGPWSTIREIHVVKDYRKRLQRPFFLRITSFLDEFFENHFLLRSFDRIVVLTEEERTSRWNKDKKVCVIPNPVRFTKSSLSPLKNKRILACGRLCYQKNYSSLLRAIRPVFDRFPDWSLDIIGEGEEYTLLRNEIKLLSLENNVFLRGTQANIQEWMSHSSLFVSTSRFEGFSLVLVEAMSCGVPVVSYSCPTGPKDIIDDGIDGFLVPPGDEISLSQRICTLIEDEALRKRMGIAALKKSERYSIERIIDMWLSLFEELRK